MGTRKIAIIEDDPASRMLVHAILEDLYEVIDYESGSDALEGLGSDKPDLVLLDVSLPKDGTEVLEKIRADESMRDCPVIALTTDALTGNREELLSHGFADYVARPLTSEDDLVDAVRRQLESR